MTSTLVHRVLAQQEVGLSDFVSQTGYRLQAAHVGAVMWIDGVNQGADQTDALRAFAASSAPLLGSAAPHLFMPVDRSTAWVWYSVPTKGAPIEVSRLHPSLQECPGMRLALGRAEFGVAGFRRTHAQAETVRAVATAGCTPSSRAVSYGDDGMAIVAMLAKDLVGTRRWVYEVLGPLAFDSDVAERLRETVRVFLGTGSSYQQTSENLVLHRNTVKYRLHKAEELRKHPLSEGRLDLELALQACHVLGREVLTPAAAPNDAVRPT